MKFVQALTALLGLVFLGACKAPEVTDRMDSGSLLYDLPIAISATKDEREPSQSLAIVAMKDMLDPGEVLYFSPRAREVLSAYGN